MSLFSKTTCSICGANFRVTGRYISDGIVCGQCRSKFSPYLEHYNNMTIADVREHLKYREKNLAALKQFRPTRVLLTARSEDEGVFGGQIYVDENRRQFLIADDKNYVATNNDLFDYSDFKSFSYTVDGEVILIKLMAFSKACNSIIEQDFEWDLYIPENYKRKPKESPEYKEAINTIQEIDKFFKSMSDNRIGSGSSVNIRCPNCGAMTTIIGRADNCKFCGATIENTFFNT